MGADVDGMWGWEEFDDISDRRQLFGELAVGFLFILEVVGASIGLIECAVVALDHEEDEEGKEEDDEFDAKDERGEGGIEFMADISQCEEGGHHAGCME